MKFLFLILFSFGAFASATRTLDGQQITNGAATLTLPTSTDTLVGRNTTDTITNKTISGASNTFSAIPASAVSSGTLAIANGGTGASTQSGAANNILPTQTGNSGKYLTTDGSNVSWATTVSGAPGLSGTDASPTNVTAGGGVVFSGTNYDNLYFLQGSGGAVTVSANPQISAATNVGQKLTIITKSNTNTLTLSDGNGLSLNGAFVGGLNSVLTLVWNGSLYVETSRR